MSLITPEEFSARKDAYKKKLTDLRKQWTADFKQEQELALEKKRQETQRVILQKAIRLRSKREDSATRSALKKYNNERANFFYREHLAKLKIIRAKKASVQKKRFESLVRSLEAESKYWVTPDNMDELITEELFNAPCTTGIVTKSSEFWRNYARCTNIKRLVFGVVPNMKDEDTINDIILERTQAERATKEDIMDTLNSMIGTGEDREKFEELVDDFSSFTKSIGGTNRKPVNYETTPDIDKMKKEDYLNMFEKGENPHEDKLLHSRVHELLGRDDSQYNPDDDLDDDSNDLLISDDDFIEDSPVDETVSASEEEESNVVDAPESDSSASFDSIESLYASAEPSDLDELVEDLTFVDENDEQTLFNAYEKIRNRVLNKHRL